MLISSPPVNSHQLTNNLTSSNNLHSSLPSSLSCSATSNPCTWSIKQVEQWLIKHDLNDCVDLICHQHRMNGQRLMNLKEDDILQLKGTTRNRVLWEQVKKLQQHYSSNYHLWATRQLTSQATHQQQQQQQQQQPQSIPMTASSYFAPSLSQAPIALQSATTTTATRPIPASLIIPPFSNHSTTAAAAAAAAAAAVAATTSASLHATLSNQQQQGQQLQNSAFNSTANPTSTTVLLERSPVTVTRSTNNQQYQRRSLSHSLSTSNASINICPGASSQRPTNALLHSHRTPADQIEDQPITGCCGVGSMRADRKKTLSACLLALCTLYFCSFIITIVDERLPDPKLFPPLPDLFLDNVTQIPWAFAVTEKIILIEMVTLLIVVALHRHR